MKIGYTVALTVGDDDGDTGSSSQTVTVKKPASNLTVSGLSPDRAQVSATIPATISGTGY